MATVLVTTMAATHTAPAGAVSSWSIVSSASPAGAPTGTFAGVACPSESNCFAVGSASGAPLAEHWDGSSWSLMTVEDPGGGFLRDIACPSPTTCVAVGDASGTPLLEQWNGARWSISTGADPGPYSVLFSVACSSVTSCFAVGSSGIVPEKTLIERWNGTTWSIVPSPSVAGADLNNFNGVSCPGPTTCFAVGNAGNGITPRTLVERWNGSAWSIVASPTPAGGGTVNLNTVSCSSDTSCFAAGDYQGLASSAPVTTLTEHWNGTTWSIVPSPNAAGEFVNTVYDVACTGDASCFATGAFSNYNGPWRSSIDRWNGTSWSVSPSPKLDPSFNELKAVACASATSCFAVGDSGTPGPKGGGPGTQKAIIERWNGSSWSLDHPVSPTPPNSALSGVACATATSCFAVGHYTNAAGRLSTLVERPAASGWSLVASPNKIGAVQSTLSSVSCVSPTFCFAVGTYTASPSHHVQTLTERWNGSTWSIVASPNNSHSANSFTNSLSSVSCTSANNCFAVGNYDNGTPKTLIEQWNGTSWSIVPSPNRARIGINLLEGVSCTGAKSCFAVGRSSTDPAGTYRTLTERWDGKQWAIVSSPDVPGQVFDDLLSVSCAGPKKCVAVGSTTAKTSKKSLVEIWNGAAWTRVTTPDPASPTRAALSGVSCPSVTSCVAVGAGSDSAGLNQPRSETLTGTAWTIASPAIPTGARNSFLSGVSCPTTAICLAVGGSDTGDAPRTLVERGS